MFKCFQWRRHFIISKRDLQDILCENKIIIELAKICPGAAYQWLCVIINVLMPACARTHAVLCIFLSKRMVTSIICTLGEWSITKEMLAVDWSLWESIKWRSTKVTAEFPKRCHRCQTHSKNLHEVIIFLLCASGAERKGDVWNGISSECWTLCFTRLCWYNLTFSWEC